MGFFFCSSWAAWIGLILVSSYYCGGTVRAFVMVMKVMKPYHVSTLWKPCEISSRRRRLSSIGASNDGCITATKMMRVDNLLGEFHPHHRSFYCSSYPSNCNVRENRDSDISPHYFRLRRFGLLASSSFLSAAAADSSSQYDFASIRRDAESRMHKSLDHLINAQFASIRAGQAR
jgi:hypothetical protein